MHFKVYVKIEADYFAAFVLFHVEKSQPYYTDLRKIMFKCCRTIIVYQYNNSLTMSSRYTTNAVFLFHYTYYL